MLLLVIALMALLPLLAVRQYRWLGEVSVGERERMRTTLQVSADGFTAEFDRELTNIYLQFQPPPLLPPSSMLRSAPTLFWTKKITTENGLPDPGEMYRQWLTTAKHLRIIDEVYQARVTTNGQPELLRLNMANHRLEPREWPEKLALVQKCLKPEQRDLKSKELQAETFRLFRGLRDQEIAISSGRNIESRNIDLVLAFAAGPLVEEIPALVVPQNILFTSPGAHGISDTAPSYVIITLNLEYIKNDFIPELTKRYFASGGAGDYIVTVLQRGESPKTIYQSDARGGDLAHLTDRELAANDVAIKFFRLRMEEIHRLLPKVLIRQNGTSETTSSGQKTSRKFAISIIQRAERGGTPSSSDPNQTIDLSTQTEGKRLLDGVWQLVVKHRAGSLEAAVENVRRRNLAISFGILLLLGTSVGLIVISSRRAQRLARRQMEFVAGVSHELRTPLAVICSAAENLADGVIDNRDQIKRYGGLIRDEGRRLGGMVEQVLEFAGAQSGRQTYELRPTELDRIIEDAVAACHLQMLEGGFELEKQIGVDLPLVNADAAALSRAIQNLLNNAMKYSGDNRWLGLYVEKVGQEVQIRVSDRGIGIPPTEMTQIFEPFYRGKEVMDAQIHGNGLGLSLVKHMIESHGGRVSVDSRLSQGASFTLHLPIVYQASI